MLLLILLTATQVQWVYHMQGNFQVTHEKGTQNFCKNSPPHDIIKFV